MANCENMEETSQVYEITELKKVCQMCSMATEGLYTIFCKKCTVIINYMYSKKLQAKYCFALNEGIKGFPFHKV